MKIVLILVMSDLTRVEEAGFGQINSVLVHFLVILDVIWNLRRYTLIKMSFLSNI